MGGAGDEGGQPLPLHDYTRVDSVDIYKAGRLAARIDRRPTENVFTYTQDWVASGGESVATTLPVSSDPVVTLGGALPPFLAGLLPEGRRLSALRRGVKTSPDDELSLLLAVGADAIGDVFIVPAGIPLAAVPPRLTVADFTHVHFRELLAELEIRVDRVGIPGAQDKVSLGMLNLPVARAGERYLLKLNPPEFPHLVENEYFFLRAARLSGIDVAKADLVHDATDEPGLVVTRFDRLPGSDGVRLLAVEDGCQALGRYPAAKYSVSTEEVLTRLSALCAAPLPAARAFLAQITFAYVTANGDAHAKNFSILQDIHGRWRPSPAYDVPSSQPYGDNTTALSIAGRRDGNITGREFVALGVSLGLPEKAARSVVSRIAGSVDGWLPGLDELPFDTGRLTKLRRTILHRQLMLRVV